jgi:predicted lipoprotein with Yx(FWY)xxD motif/uncharacterized protein GlcG (DUF336 family)
MLRKGRSDVFRSGSFRRLAVLVPLLVVALLVAAAVVVYAAASGAGQTSAFPAQPVAARAFRSSLQITSTTTMTPTTIMTPTSAAALTASDLDMIVQQAVTAPNTERSLLRVNAQGQPATTAMQIAIVDRDGRQLRFYGMPDAWVGSINIAIGKARTAAYFSSNQNAMTSRSIGALSQPGGDLWQIGNSNAEGPVGLIQFPGGLPLYKVGVLVGAIGVSGDGVNHDEAVAVAGAKGFEPPAAIRIDTVTKGAVPYTAAVAAATATPMPAPAVTATPAATSTVAATGTTMGTPTALATSTAAALPTVMATGTATSTGSAPASVAVNTSSAGKFGTILVDPKGMSLYVYAKDSPNASTCTGGCAAAWPPLFIADGGKIVAGTGVTGTLTVIGRPDSTHQIAYKGMPLYLWAKDTKPGDVTGDGVGGVWTVAKP